MSATETKKSDELKQLFEQLELFSQSKTACEQPREWLQQMHLQVTKTERLMRDTIDQEHQSLYKQIRRENNDLIRRVEQLRENDEHVLNEARWLLESAEAALSGGEVLSTSGDPSIQTQTQTQSQVADSGQREAGDKLTEIHRRLTVYAVSGRKHLDEVTHWFLEAFMRDRGVVD